MELAIYAGLWCRWGGFSAYQMSDLVSAIQTDTKHLIFPIAGPGLLHNQDNYGVCWLKFLPIFHRVWPSSMRLRCLGRNSKRNLHVYAYLLTKSFSGQKSVLYLLHLPVFSESQKDLKLNDLHSIQANNVSKHCWMLKQKITALLGNDVFQKTDTIFYFAVVDRNNCYCGYMQPLTSTFLYAFIKLWAKDFPG